VHYYKFNIPDWSLGAGHLSLVEEAVYFRLVNFYYDSELPIPIDYIPVLRKLRMADQKDAAEQILSEFFVKTDKGYTHKRCEKLLKEYRKTSKNNRENGAKGGRPKKDADCKETQDKPSGLFSQTQSKPTDNPNQELITKNYKPVTNNQLKEKYIPPQADEIEKVVVDKPIAEKKSRATRLPEDWKPTREYYDEMINIDEKLKPKFKEIAATFRDYWVAKSGKDATKADWLATWRNWVRREAEKNAKNNGSYSPSYHDRRADLTDAVTDYHRATNF
jgi:uncharacterized protein YdaU (DUF1376 family)